MGISTLLELAASAYGDRVALGRAAGGLSYQELSDRVAQAATGLEQAGGYHVAYVGNNGPEFTISMFAAAHLGRPIVPLNYRLTDEARSALLAELEDPLVLVQQAATAPDGHRQLNIQQWLASAADLEPANGVDGGDPTAVLLFTSGTTAAPKGVLLSHDQLLAYVLQSVEFAACEPDEAALVTVPPYHIAGVASALTNLYAGRRVLHLPSFTPEGWLELIRSNSVTSATVVPTMLVRIVEYLDAQGAHSADVPSLRSLAYGGSAISARVLRRALELFPAVEFANAYGLTETSSTIAVLGPEDHRAAMTSTDPSVRDRLASAGRPIPGIEVVIRDEAGAVINDDRHGDLFVRGPQVSGRYLKSGSSLDADGWFATRDRARQDAAGYLFLQGRTDDTIIRGAENIAAAEIEKVLLEHPDVRDVAVVGLPDEEWGQLIAAAVVLIGGSGATDSDIKIWVRQRLRSSKTPDVVVMVTELPYSPTGKMLRRVVTDDLLAAQCGGQR